VLRIFTAYVPRPRVTRSVRQNFVKNWFPWKNRPKAPTADRGSRVLRAALAGDGAKLREAVESGDDVNAWDENGMTPLLSAVFIGDREAVRLLLSVGADPNRPSQDDPTDTPLWRARDDFGIHEIADLLVQAGANENRSA
jgi:ankyrin repeat protein